MKNTKNFGIEKSLIAIKMVSGEIGFGGGERIFLDIAKAFKDLGFSIKLMSPRNSKLSKLFDQLELHADLSHQGLSKAKLRIVIANDFDSIVKFCFLLRIRKVLICHGPWELTWKKRIFYRIFGIHLFCVSNYVATQAFKGIGMRQSKVTILHYGPEPIQKENKYSKSLIAREKFNLSPEACVIGSLSRYHSVKRIDMLIEMFRGKDHILLLGLSKGFNTEDERKTKKLIDNLDIPSNVRIFEDVNSNDFFDAIDIHISLSTSETLGLTFLEASARGIPSFTTATGGVNDYMVHGLNGYFLNENNPNDYQSIFFSKLQDRKLLERIARNCLKININRSPGIAATQIIEKII